LIEGQVIETYRLKERSIIILDVPALQCQSCGEQWLLHDTLKQIDTILDRIGNDRDFMNPFNAKEPILIKYEHPFDAFLTTVILPKAKRKKTAA